MRSTTGAAIQKATKCDLCHEMPSGPACAAACPHDALVRIDLSDSKPSELYGQTLFDPKKGPKSIAKAGKEEGYKFDTKELAAALDEMNKGGEFDTVELDAAALASLTGMGGVQQLCFSCPVEGGEYS